MGTVTSFLITQRKHHFVAEILDSRNPAGFITQNRTYIRNNLILSQLTLNVFGVKWMTWKKGISQRK